MIFIESSLCFVFRSFGNCATAVVVVVPAVAAAVDAVVAAEIFLFFSAVSKNLPIHTALDCRIAIVVRS